MSAFLDLVAQGRIDVHGLISERIPVERARDAYERLASKAASPLGVVLEYGRTERLDASRPRSAWAPAAPNPKVNVVGAGSFAQRVLVPNLKKAGLSLGVIASANGLTAKSAADRFGFVGVTTPQDAVSDPEAELVVIATRHGSHASLAQAALRSGKAVFVEKPPCLTDDELDAVRAARAESGRPLFVGFNRRHAPFAIALRNHVRESQAPIELIYRISAQALPPGTLAERSGRRGRASARRGLSLHRLRSVGDRHATIVGRLRRDSPARRVDLPALGGSRSRSALRTDRSQRFSMGSKVPNWFRRNMWKHTQAAVPRSSTITGRSPCTTVAGGRVAGRQDKTRATPLNSHRSCRR